MSAIIDFFSSIINVVIGLVNMLINTFHAAINLVKMIPSLIATVIQFLGYMPSTIYAYAFVCIMAMVIWAFRRAI